MRQIISADMLYNYIQCPHRLYLDIFEDPSKRDPESAFMKLLWERGIDFEKQVMVELKKPFLDLSVYTGLEKEARTREALRQGVTLIYSGRISTDNLVGEPDLLLKQGGGYIAGDIKSGSALEGENNESEGKLKIHYAIQLGLYTDILEKLNYSSSKTSFIHDIKGRDVFYDLVQSIGKRDQMNWWDLYLQTLSEVQQVLEKKITTSPAHQGACKLCHWRTYCLKSLITAKDLTLIPELGRKKREIMHQKLKKFTDFAHKSFQELIIGKKTIFPGIGISTLYKYHARARLLAHIDKQAYIIKTIKLPQTDTELFFDVETDPMRDFCYLHGFVERHHRDPATEKYVPFFADKADEKQEERIFIDAWHYIKQHFPCNVYYYSPYEKTIWKKLNEKYPEIITSSELEALFKSPLVIDLYSDIVRKYTEWPTYSYSVKDLAQYLGFRWRDEHPSGAESIEWYHRWLELERPEIKKRILQYNEDDCIAMRVLLEGIQELPIKNH
ncbi:MAG: TM0106 family RecB-like putative nuclease [Atribacterota bacterium]|nr:TM0106 family RecB-like putative nuclease [Atribacterota bacterium]